MTSIEELIDYREKKIDTMKKKELSGAGGIVLLVVGLIQIYILAIFFPELANQDTFIKEIKESVLLWFVVMSMLTLDVAIFIFTQDESVNEETIYSFEKDYVKPFIENEEEVVYRIDRIIRDNDKGPDQYIVYYYDVNRLLVKETMRIASLHTDTFENKLVCKELTHTITDRYSKGKYQIQVHYNENNEKNK